MPGSALLLPVQTKLIRLFYNLMSSTLYKKGNKMKKYMAILPWISSVCGLYIPSFVSGSNSLITPASFRMATKITG